METTRKLYPHMFNRGAWWPQTISGSSFVCLEIMYSNSSASCSFSDAFLDVKNIRHPSGSIRNIFAVSERRMFTGIMYDTLFNKELKTEAVEEAFNSLENFLNNIDQHLKCVKQLKEKEIKEGNIRTTLALHLFKPLSGDASIIIDQHTRCHSRCQFCSETVQTGDTSIGCADVWHGLADILLVQNIVKIDSMKVEDSEATEEYTFASSQSSKDDEEPYSTVVDVKNSSIDSYMPSGPKKLMFGKSFNNSVLSEVLSQTIVNAFYQVKKNPQLKDCYIPTFLVSDKYITIHMYNPTSDVLLTQVEAMGLFYGETFAPDTILVLWMALHMNSFSKFFPGHEIPTYPPSNFKTLTKNELKLYETEIERGYRLSRNESLSDLPLFTEEEKLFFEIHAGYAQHPR